MLLAAFSVAEHGNPVRLYAAGLVGWRIFWHLAGYVRYRRDASLAACMIEDGVDGTTANQKVARLQGRLKAILHRLGRTDPGQANWQGRPWYAVIGPSGAGKTTALRNAGLRLDSITDAAISALRSIGGTKFCECWITEHAVLIDIAGRCVQPGASAAMDQGGWSGFLKLLRNVRPQQPLNGLIIMVALDEVAAASGSAGLDQARAIRQRVSELQAQPGARLPAYLLFTKADLIAGFSEFFGDLDSARRSRVWGMTFSRDLGSEGYIETFGRQFHDLLRQLETHLFRRLQTERKLERRAAIALFPGQMRSLEPHLTSFLQEMLRETAETPALFLHGIYFTSAVQNGKPFDNLLGMVARAFGTEPRPPPGSRAGADQSYFLSRLLHEVILGGTGLVPVPPSVTNRRRLIRIAGLATAGLAVFVGAGTLWHRHAAGVRQIEASMTAVQAYAQAAAGLPLNRVANADMRQVAPLLDRAQAAMSVGDDESGFGLSQSLGLRIATHRLYDQALQRILLPRLIWRLESQIRDSMGRPDFLYEATRIYLMLGGAGPLDSALVHEWMKLDWQSLYPNDPGGRFRDSLLRHLDALLREPLAPVALDDDLLTKARETFAKVSPAQRAYSRIRLSPAAQQLQPWRPVDALGAAGAALFTRSSGKPLTDGIAGFLTVTGFHAVLLPSLAQAAHSVVTESWVVGQRTNIDTGTVQMRRLERDILGLYEADYVQAWDAMLADLNVTPLGSVSQAAQDLFILASPQSPMRKLLVSIARQLTLSVPPSTATPARPDIRTAPGLASRTDGIDARLRMLSGDAVTAKTTGTSPGHAIDERYAALHDVVDGPTAQIGQVLRSFNDLQQQFAKAAAATSGIAVLAGMSDPSPALRVEALRQPEPLAHWLATLAASGAALRNGDTKR